MDEAGDDGPYDWESESPEECRSRMLALFVMTATGALFGGMAIAFFLDWLQRSVF